MDDPDLGSGLDPKRRVELARRLEALGLAPDAVDPLVRGRLEQRARRRDARLAIGRYLVLGELGRGGMGVVYEGFDPGIERRVAIKTLEPDLVPEEERDEVVERFRRETKIVARLEHPSIVTVFDYGVERTPHPGAEGYEVVHFYVMEFLEGRSLARALREDGPLEPRRAVEVARSMAEALELSHGAGVIHRDIKPSNVFLRERGDAVLLDFGIAKSGSVALTRQGQILGTPSYLAPERLREKEAPIDGRADLFSLGVLLFTMMTGETPFVGADVYEIIDKIAKEAHPALGGATPAARALESVVDRLLAKRPEDRFDDAGSAAAALGTVLLAIDAEALPAARPPREGPPPPPEPSGPISSGASELEGASSTAEVSDAPSAAEAGAPAAEDPAPRADLDSEPSPMDLGAADLGAADLGAADLGAAEVSPSEAPAGAPDPSAEEVQASVRPRAGDDEDFAATAVGPPPSESDEALRGFDAEGDVDQTTDGERPRPRAAEAFATRPELALQRETRELGGSSIAAEWSADETMSDDEGAIPREEVEEETLADPAFRARLPAALGGLSGRPRIEVALVDEEDVVVRPAPLSELDEAPTQATFPIAGEEAKRPSAEDAARGSPARASTPPRPHRPLSRGGAEPMVLRPEGDAAVARRTFGVSAAARRAQARDVEVRVSGARLDEGTAELERRSARRRWALLALAVLLSVGTGLALGRFGGSGSPPTPVAAEEEEARPPVAAAKANPAPDEARSARSLVSDAEAARTAGALERSAALYARAIERAEASDAELRARAWLGRADVLRSAGRVREATKAYRKVLAESKAGSVASQARVALAELGAQDERSRSTPRPAEPAPAERGARATSKERSSAPPRRERSSFARTPEAACREILFRHVADPGAAVAAFAALTRAHPTAPCGHWNLGVKSETTGELAQAARAYRRYLELVPDTPRRDAVERRIENLEARLP